MEVSIRFTNGLLSSFGNPEDWETLRYLTAQSSVLVAPINASVCKSWREKPQQQAPEILVKYMNQSISSADTGAPQRGLAKVSECSHNLSRESRLKRKSGFRNQTRTGS